MSDKNDIDIIDEVLNGNVDSFAGITKKYHNRVFRFVYSKVGDFEEAIDVTQEIFVITFEALKSFRKESKFSTWLYSIMVNYCKNYKKRRERFNHVSISRDDGSNSIELLLSDERNDHVENIISNDSLRIVKEELNKLPEVYKEILLLRDINGLSYNDISSVLNVSITNVKVRIHRGRKLLTNRLEKRGLI